MKISTKGRYALRLMMDLAQYHDGRYIALKEISARQEISVKYLEHIVIVLARAGFVKSIRVCRVRTQAKVSPLCRSPQSLH